jgi:hypothetical protein
VTVIGIITLLILILIAFGAEFTAASCGPQTA